MTRYYVVSYTGLIMADRYGYDTEREADMIAAECRMRGAACLVAILSDADASTRGRGWTP